MPDRLPEGFAQFMEVAPDAMVCVDKQGTIIVVNQQTEELFGRSRDEILGEKIEVLIPKRYAEAHVGHRDAYVADPHVRPMGQGRELWALREDGTEFPVEISLSPVAEGIVAASIRDVSERLKAEAKFRSLLDSTPDGMVIVDQTGTITLVNAQAETMFGHPRADMVGQKIELLIPQRFHGRHEGHRDGFFQAPKNRSMGSGLELFAVRADGTEFPVEISLSPISTEEGRLVAAAVRDVTDRKAAEADAAAAREQTQKLRHLEELDAFRTNFINAAAHELNTPITPIAATLKLLEISKDDKAREEALTILNRSFKRLGGLISDLLEAARFQSGKLKLQVAPTDLAAIVANVVSEFDATAQEKGIDLQVETPEVQVTCDNKRLTQVLYNLLSNALKFTEEGTIQVRAGMDEVAWVEVQDSGAGLTQEQLGRLFQPFSRVHGTAIPGTGLGLYVSQGFMHAHGGTLTASSSGPGEGATFRLTLPL